MLASLHDADFRLDSKPGEGTRAVLTFPRIRTLAPDPWPTGEAA
jgi:signal transduction histidine kinase